MTFLRKNDTISIVKITVVRIGEIMEENKVNDVGSTNSFKEFYKKHKSKFNFAYMVIICLVAAKLITSFVFLSVILTNVSKPIKTRSCRAFGGHRRKMCRVFATFHS